LCPFALPDTIDSMSTEKAVIAGPPVKRPLSRIRRDLVFFGVALFILGFDQVTKAIINRSLRVGESWPDPDWFVKITHVTNTGAAFGILQGQAAFLAITSIIGIGAIVVYYLFPPFDHWIVRVAMGMLLGGAAGNFLDRVRVGHVTDFIDFSFWPTFNVADSSISIGVTVLIVGYLFDEFFGQRAKIAHGTTSDTQGGDVGTA
jgi:signal peptidase II